MHGKVVENPNKKNLREGGYRWRDATKKKRKASVELLHIFHFPYEVSDFSTSKVAVVEPTVSTAAASKRQ